MPGRSPRTGEFLRTGPFLRTDGRTALAAPSGAGAAVPRPARRRALGPWRGPLGRRCRRSGHPLRGCPDHRSRDICRAGQRHAGPAVLPQRHGHRRPRGARRHALRLQRRGPGARRLPPALAYRRRHRGYRPHRALGLRGVGDRAHRDRRGPHGAAPRRDERRPARRGGLGHSGRRLCGRGVDPLLGAGAGPGRSHRAPPQGGRLALGHRPGAPCRDLRPRRQRQCGAHRRRPLYRGGRGLDRGRAAAPLRRRRTRHAARPLRGGALRRPRG